MPLVNHLNKLLDVDIHFTDQQSGPPDILVSKGNQIHVTLLMITATYGFLFTFVSYLQAYHYQALFSFLCFVFSFIAWMIFRSGRLLLSKLVNLGQLIIVIALMFYFPSAKEDIHANDSILAYYIPVSIGCVVAFQGKEKRYGYFYALSILLIMATLIVLDLHLPEHEPVSKLSGLNWDLLSNVVGASVATFGITVYVIALNNRLNESLIKANTELDNFVYIVSHDLRSPLLSTSGLLELAKMRIDEKEQVLKYLGMAGRSIGNLDDIIREILAYSRNSRTGIHVEEFDLKKLIRDIFDGLRFNASNDFSFLEEYHGNTLITCDKARLNTALRNIISNSVKYRNKSISDPYVKVIFTNTGSRFTIQVTDNGEGIPASSMEKVFDMFYRGTASAQGTGLGLYICKEILNKMNAEFSIDSVEGMGTTFSISLKRLNKPA